MFQAIAGWSLRSRIIISAIFVVIVVLPIIGVALNNAFEAQARESLKEQLNAYFYSVLAVSEFENDELLMPEVLLENQFNLINSGLYALITTGKVLRTNPKQSDESVEIIWSSNSFLDLPLSTPLPIPNIGNSEFSEIFINQQLHYVFSYSIRFDVGSASTSNKLSDSSFTVHIIKNSSAIEKQQKAFSQQLWLWLAVLICVLLIIQIFWLIWTLRPLRIFASELNAVQQGEAELLKQDYPKELNTVAKQLNTLLSNEQRQRRRYRNALSDLAHSLKTPLAVIQSQQDLSDASMEQVRQINRTIEYQLKRAQSSGKQAWHLGCKLKPIADKLFRALHKIYPDITIIYGKAINETLMFYGDERDINEILGNLLDNACKAADKQVKLCAYTHESDLIISVEDDGLGIDPKQRECIVERGVRADTYAQGHGIGLAIVVDLVASYEGEIDISVSQELGGACFNLRFKYS